MHIPTFSPQKKTLCKQIQVSCQSTYELHNLTNDLSNISTSCVVLNFIKKNSQWTNIVAGPKSTTPL